MGQYKVKFYEGHNFFLLMESWWNTMRYQMLAFDLYWSGCWAKDRGLDRGFKVIHLTLPCLRVLQLCLSLSRCQGCSEDETCSHLRQTSKVDIPQHLTRWLQKLSHSAAITGGTHGICFFGKKASLVKYKWPVFPGSLLLAFHCSYSAQWCTHLQIRAQRHKSQRRMQAFTSWCSSF